MAITETADEQSERKADDDLREWKDETECVALKTKYMAIAIIATFENADLKAFEDLSYSESIWHLITELEEYAATLDKLMQKHVVSLREKNGY